ncbi:hypothetical protein F4821DRAFT_265722 [Hypoxylon rubiginosum]|uniref:Uncharacterized protein n=1 Tax=Hypoxylon rubiginosum TaxID=110542 RepID=A0ACC0CJW0_9PEZI|nr:hypothetical protein F4821DRAFT_265722 [Hypoxylon rubiginosum]
MGPLQPASSQPSSSNHHNPCSALLNIEIEGTSTPITEAAFVDEVLQSRTRHFGSTYMPNALLRQDEPLDNQYMSFVSKVVRVICDQSSSRFSIDDVIEDLCRTDYDSVNVTDPTIHSQLRQAVFGAVGLVTFLYDASVDDYQPNSFTIDNTGNESLPRRGSLTLARDRLFILLAAFGDIFLSADFNDTDPVPEEQEEPLYVSRLSYDFLSNICGMSIVWTDSLGLHLHLNPNSRELFLFRFPSFCIVNLDEKASKSVFHRVLMEYHRTTQGHQHGRQAHSTSQAFLQEVIHSYRVIFCDGPSRKKFASTLKARAHAGGKVDHVLVQLCEQSKLTTTPAIFSQMQHRDVYNAQNDFPLLRNRLTALQKYSMRHDPKSIRQILRDRRHPLESLNMKAVIIFGVLSLLIGLLQVIVGAAQLAFAIKQTQLSANPRL